MKKKILLVSYVFPPYPGVGGRRWAKFAKYLATDGYEIHVICAKNPVSEQSNWLKDVHSENIIVHSLPGKFPQVLLGQPHSFFQKLHYRFWQVLFRFFSKGYTFERTLFWRKNMAKKAGEIISAHRIDTVIATGPPFLHLQTVVSLKKKYPGLKVVTDLRDPWTDNKSFMGFNTMPPDRLGYEKQMEREVLENSDAVLTVADQMTETLRHKIKHRQNSFYTLSNGYDPDEISIVEDSEPAIPATREKLRLIYTGSLYTNLEFIFIPFADWLVKLRNENPRLYAKLAFDFYGSAALEMRRIIQERKLNDIVKFNNWISQEEIGKQIAASDGCLLFFAPDHSFSMNTKFFEYIARKKPVILFSNPGETPDFVIRNRLGYVIGPDHLEEELSRLLDLHFSTGLKIDRNFDPGIFSIPSLTRELTSILDSLQRTGA